MTLFDSPEDDEFDGDLGEDDDETPRILLKFDIETHHKISKVNIATENKDSIKNGKRTADHGDEKNMNQKLDSENTGKQNCIRKEDVNLKNSSTNVVSVPLKNEKETEIGKSNKEKNIKIIFYRNKKK